MMEKCHWELNVLSVEKRGYLEKAVDTCIALTTGWLGTLSALLRGSAKDKFFVFCVVFLFFFNCRIFHLIHLDSGTVSDKQARLQVSQLTPWRMPPFFFFCTLKRKAAFLIPQWISFKADLETKTWIHYIAQTEKTMKKIHKRQYCSQDLMFGVLLCVQITSILVAKYSISTQDPSPWSLPTSPSPTWNFRSNQPNLLTCWWPWHVPGALSLCPLSLI